MTQEIINRLKELLAKATDVTEADLMRYEHGGGRWAKLRDGERTLVADFYNEADREAHVAAWLALPALLSTLTNLTPSGVERIRAELIEALVKGTRLDISYEEATDAVEDAFAALALPSEPPSGDVEGRARKVERLAHTVHNARFGPGVAPYPFDDEDAGGQEYCRRIARAVLASKERS